MEKRLVHTLLVKCKLVQLYSGNWTTCIKLVYKKLWNAYSLTPHAYFQDFILQRNLYRYEMIYIQIILCCIVIKSKILEIMQRFCY